MYTRSATLGHSVNTVNAQAGKFFNKIGDLIQGSMAGIFNNNNIIIIIIIIII